MEDKLMRHIILTALITCLAVRTAAALVTAKPRARTASHFTARLR
jgi:hypothetical protein